jgi:hypothetical protein
MPDERPLCGNGQNLVGRPIWAGCGRILVLTLFPPSVPIRQTGPARSISGGLGMRLVQKEHALRNIAAASNCSQSRSTIEPSVDPLPAMSAKRT